MARASSPSRSASSSWPSKKQKPARNMGARQRLCASSTAPYSSTVAAHIASALLEQVHHGRIGPRGGGPFGAVGQSRLGQLVGSSQSSRDVGRAQTVGATFGDRTRSDQPLTPGDVQPTRKLGRVGAERQQAAL